MIIEKIFGSGITVSDTIFVDVAKNVTTQDEVNTLILMTQYNTLFELIFDICFVGVCCIAMALLVHGGKYIFSKVFKKHKLA
jgi:hypothetical protein